VQVEADGFGVGHDVHGVAAVGVPGDVDGDDGGPLVVVEVDVADVLASPWRATWRTSARLRCQSLGSARWPVS
jgi:hypothetical protein